MGSVLEKLQQVRADGQEIAKLKEQLAIAEALAERVTAAMDGESVCSSKTKSPMENAADKAIELMAKIAELETANDQRKQYLSGVIDAVLDKKEKTVLRGIYFDCKTKTALVSKLDCTWQTIYKKIFLLNRRCNKHIVVKIYKMLG